MSPNPNDIRVLVAAWDPLARAGLAALLSSQPGFTVAGQVSGGSDLAQAQEDYSPDVVLWDLGWDTSESLERLADAQESGLPVLALLADEGHAPEVWAAGALGILPRDAAWESIAAALAAVSRGLAVLLPSLAAAAFAARPQPSSPLPEDLTPREKQVLALLAEGRTNKAIARHLGITDHTVKFHINAILSKLGAQSRTEAVVLATRLGLITM